jgi:hypothetical protein
MFRYYGFLGLISILSAYLLSFSNAIPHLSINKSLNNFLLLAGLWLFFDAIDFKLNKTSLLHKIKFWRLCLKSMGG